MQVQRRRRCVLAGVVVALLLSTSCTQGAQQSSTESQSATLSEANVADARDKVGALLAAWATAGNEGRWADIPPLFADDPGFVWVERGEVRYASRAEAVAGIEGVAASGATVETIVPEVSVAPIGPDAAAFTAPLRFRLIFPGAQPIEMDGVISGVAVKRNGDWKFLQGHVATKPTTD